MDIGEKIRQQRRITKLSQEKLSDLIGVSLKTVQRWEYGERIPRADELGKLAQALGTTAGYLLGETENADAPDVPQEQALTQLLQYLSSLTAKNTETINMEENKEKIKDPLLGTEYLPNTPPELGVAYWGSVVDNALRVAKSKNAQDKEMALTMLRMAENAITGDDKTEQPPSVSAYNGNNSSYSGNTLEYNGNKS